MHRDIWEGVEILGPRQTDVFLMDRSWTMCWQVLGTGGRFRIRSNENKRYCGRVTDVAWLSWDCMVLELEVSHPGDPLCPGMVGHSSE